MPVKNIGNYRTLPQQKRETFQRRVGQLLSLQPDRLTVRWIDGKLGTLPAGAVAAFQRVGIIPGDSFALVTVFRGREVVDVRVERTSARPAIVSRDALPKVMMRDGLKLTTRR